MASLSSAIFSKSKNIQAFSIQQDYLDNINGRRGNIPQLKTATIQNSDVMLSCKILRPPKTVLELQIAENEISIERMIDITSLILTYPVY